MTTTPIYGEIRSGWGKRKSLIPGMSTFHRGVDVAAATGTPVVAPAAGRVVTSSWNAVRGHYVVVDHGDGWSTEHQHLSKRFAVVGQHVDEGDVIGLCGRSGTATGPHLHTEVREHGTPIDPAPWYLARGVILGSAARAAAPVTPLSEEDDVYILICHDARRGYWLVGPGHAHQFNQNPGYPEEFDEFRARFPEIRVKQYDAGDAGVRDFDCDKAIFTQAHL